MSTPISDHDLGLLADILKAAWEAQNIVDRGRTYYLSEDFLPRRAMEKSLQNVGEAAGHLSRPFQDAHPNVPWHAIEGLRNVLAHEYGAIDHELLWDIAAGDIPDLVKSLPPLP